MELMQALEESVMRELEDSEAQVLEQYETYRAEEGAELDSLARDAEALEALGCADAAVLCPLCKKDWLLQSDTVFFCRCGFRLDTKNDAIDMGNLQDLLEAAFESHR